MVLLMCKRNTITAAGKNVPTAHKSANQEVIMTQYDAVADQ